MNIRLLQSVICRPIASAKAIAAATALVATMGGYASAQPGSVNDYASGFQPGTQIVSASSVQTAADVAPPRMGPGEISQALGVSPPGERQAAPIAQASYGCQNCAQPSCNGGCNRYAGHGYYPGGGDMAAFSNACGIPCDPYNYVIVEGLYMERSGEDNFSLTRNVRMDEFDFEFAPRITLGTLPNCVNGFEFTWIGPLDFSRAVTAVDPAGNIDSVLQAGGTFDGTLLDPFQDSNLQVQSYNSEYWSAEVNRTVVGWDVAKVLFGGRFIRIEEDFGYAAEKDVFSSFADLTNSVENSLVGLQIGLDLLYPVARNLYTDFRGRAGAYMNFAESNTRLRNQGVTVVELTRDDEELAGVFELGGGLRYQLGRALSIRAGAEMWYITAAATSAGQINNPVTEAFASQIDIGDELFYYGFNAGAELRF
jgi:hypothetical protein